MYLSSLTRIRDVPDNGLFHCFHANSSPSLLKHGTGDSLDHQRGCFDCTHFHLCICMFVCTKCASFTHYMYKWGVQMVHKWGHFGPKIFAPEEVWKHFKLPTSTSTSTPPTSFLPLMSCWIKFLPLRCFFFF